MKNLIGILCDVKVSKKIEYSFLILKI